MEARRVFSGTLPRACTVAKWGSPAEELSGIAQLAARDAQRGVCRASDMRLAVPSVNWGVQLQRVCASQKVPALFCAPHARLDANDRMRVAKLAALADPGNAAAQRACIDAGASREELDALLGSYADARGHTLVKVVGLKESMSLRHATLHVRGDENAGELYAIVRAQMERPTFPPEAETIPIVLMSHVREGAKRVFAVGCVDGLVPSYAKDSSDERRRQAIDEGRAIFSSCVSSAQDSAMISYFTRIEEHTARAAGISFARTRLQDGVRVALTRPTPFLAEWGAELPATVGGQTLLRKGALN